MRCDASSDCGARSSIARLAGRGGGGFGEGARVGLAVRGVRAEVLLAERAVRPRYRDAAEDLRGGELLAQLGAHGVGDRLLREVLRGHASARAHRPDLLARLH